MKITKALIASFCFLIALSVIYFIHMRYLHVNVLFYAAITDGLLAAITAGVTLVVFKYFNALNKFEKWQLFLIWILLGYIFAISVPTVIDRSLSFYILEKLQQRGGGIRQSSFESVFTSEYLREHHLVEVRLTEQQQSGTIVIENGCVKLTKKGFWIAGISRAFRQNLLPKQRLLLGNYTDALTDPFRFSNTDVNYTCQ
jgi:hypothetical protein